MTHIDPTTPGDLAEVSVRDLVDGWFDHLAVVVDARRRTGEPRPAEQVVGAALGMLATGQAITNRISWSRWTTVVDALRAGARLAAIAAAMGVTEPEVEAGLMSWLRGQIDLHERTGTLGLSEAEAEDVQVLAEGARTQVQVTLDELATELGVSPPQLVRLIGSLVEKGLFDRINVERPLTSDVAATVRLLIVEQEGQR